jgi:A/G-specific adenine glycosylase
VLAAESSHVWLHANIPDAALPAPVKKLLLEPLGNRNAAQQRMF